MIVDTHWYYVEDQERIGPISRGEMESLYKSSKLNNESFIWRKGMDNWEKLNSVDEFSFLWSKAEAPEGPAPIPRSLKKGFNWELFDHEERVFTIKIGIDRGGAHATEYGPFSANEILKMLDENRINEKTLIFSGGFESWTFFGDIEFFKKAHRGLPPVIEEKDRRRNIRRPFVARMFFHDNLEIFEGICRDISVGGLQILVSHFPGKVGENISLNVHPTNSDFSFVASGEIVRKLEGDQGLSLRFHSLSEEASSAILNYLGQDGKA